MKFFRRQKSGTIQRRSPSSGRQKSGTIQRRSPNSRRSPQTSFEFSTDDLVTEDDVTNEATTDDTDDVSMMSARDSSRMLESSMRFGSDEESDSPLGVSTEDSTSYATSTTSGTSFSSYTSDSRDSEMIAEHQLLIDNAPMTCPTERALRMDYDYESNQWVKHYTTVQIGRIPFARGLMRKAFRCVDHGHPDERYVAKRYYHLDGWDDSKPARSYEVDVEMQAFAEYWALKYNACNPPKMCEFVPCYLLRMVDRKSQPHFCCEPYIPGAYEKMNNNCGWVSDHRRNTPHAFSHFSYEASNQQMIIVDIQGVMDFYTDPQIHHVSASKWGHGNLGVEGIDEFFLSHKCNEICRWLGLPRRMRHRVVVSDFSSTSLSEGTTCAGESRAGEKRAREVFARPGDDLAVKSRAEVRALYEHFSVTRIKENKELHSAGDSSPDRGSSP